MHCKIKRVTRHNKNFNPHDIDKQFLFGRLLDLPRVGEGMKFDLGPELWLTAPVKEVKFLKGILVAKTYNSDYHIKGV